MARITGLDHLTVLDVAPPGFVAVAAGAGFDAVGLRIAPVTPDEETARPASGWTTCRSAGSKTRASAGRRRAG
jgi:hypothetical protein